jgi:dipeptidyl aminopeptidase/acylaminoacyl peptidase
MADVAPYGQWTSPISAAFVAAGGLRLGAVAVDGDDVYWLEGRPGEGGRNALVRRAADGGLEDVLPRDVNVRSRAHEYGGGAYTVANGAIYFVNFADQRIYRSIAAVRSEGDGPIERDPPHPVTAPGAYCYADLALDTRRRQLICVREDHSGTGEPVSTIVRVRADDAPAPTEPAPTESDPSAVATATTNATTKSDAPSPPGDVLGYGEVLVSGHDFYSTPRVNPDGTRLAWLAWRHPRMPWDGTELWVAELTPDGTVENARQVAGGDTESIYQPGWSPDGTLYCVSDRDGWWKLYRAQGDATSAIVRNAPTDAEFGRPQWVFGTATWACVSADRMVAAYTRHGRWHLATVHLHTGLLTDIDTDRAPQEWVAATARHVVFVGASPTKADAVVQLALDTGRVDILRSASDVQLDEADISVPEAIAFPTTAGLTAHAFYYAPRNRNVVGPRGDRPPLIVLTHGGPTTAAKATFDLQVQFWTSRGFAVADVNYGGSTGYGRAYRDRLKGQWGIVDVADVVSTARHLVAEGKADARKLIARGGSAGGYTTLAALTFQPGVFAAGASYYGVSDLEVLARDTHKFEARYLDSLIGPYPEMKDVYRARSPIHFVDELACALILFQGLEDKVVPPNQSQMMADAVRKKGLPVEYLVFEGEQHGFRRADTIRHCLDAEFAFYGTIM